MLGVDKKLADVEKRKSAREKKDLLFFCSKIFFDFIYIFYEYL